jgi:hypothetical protein
VRLWLSVIAYDLGNVLRRLVLPKGSNRGCSPACSSGFEDRRPVGKACAVLLADLAEGHLTRICFAAMVRRIETLPLPVN